MDTRPHSQPPLDGLNPAASQCPHHPVRSTSQPKALVFVSPLRPKAPPAVQAWLEAGGGADAHRRPPGPVYTTPPRLRVADRRPREGPRPAGCSTVRAFIWDALCSFSLTQNMRLRNTSTVLEEVMPHWPMVLGQQEQVHTGEARCTCSSPPTNGSTARPLCSALTAPPIGCQAWSHVVRPRHPPKQTG